MARGRNIAINPQTGQLVCYGQGTACYVARFTAVGRGSSVFDDRLEKFSSQLNAIVEDARKEMEQDNKEQLALLATPEGFVLCTVTEAINSVDNSDEEILRALDIPVSS